MANNDFIIPPIDQDAYFRNALFYQYLGTEEGSQKMRAFISGAYTDSSNGIEYLCQSVLDAFCLDCLSGNQLDTVGKLVGLVRPTLSQIGQAGFFGFDSLPNLPFDFGTFQDGRTLNDALVSDDQYRLFLKIKIAANVWDGTRPGLKSILMIATGAEQIVIENVPFDAGTSTPFVLDGIEGQGFDDGQFDVGLYNYEPFFLDATDERNGFDNGQFDIGVGYATPATFQIIFTGGVTQDDIDALRFLDLIPTPHGVRLYDIYLNEIETLIDGLGNTLIDGLGNTLIVIKEGD